MASESQPATPIAIVGRLLGFLFNFLRAMVYLLVLALFIGAIVAISRSDTIPIVPEAAVLVVNPTEVVEEYPAFDEFEQVLIDALDISTPTRLRDLLSILEAARDDDRIKAVHLDLSNLAQMSYVHIDEIGAALRELSDAGKPVIGSTVFLNQFRYALLSYSDEIYLNYFDGIDMIGPVAEGVYIADALDKLKVERFVHGSGPYKSAGDSLVRNDMSDAEREQVSRLLESRWAADQARVIRNRGISPDRLQAYVDGLPELLTEAEGDISQLALDFDFADGTGWRMAIDQRIEELTSIVAGEDRMTYQSYARTLPPDFDFEEKQRVAVVYGMGAIYDGSAEYGAISGDGLSDTIRDLGDKDDVAALVLRVDSPGGSASASEAIREQLQAVQERGKPVVVSMAGVAASGGYWVSATADEIWAHPETITGSIGAVGTALSLDESFAAIGMHSERVTTTQVAENLLGEDGISDLNRRMVTLFIEAVYSDFLELVATGRDKPRDAVHEIAQGRVWIGSDAMERGLVDQLGGLQDAIKSAAALAGLEDDYRVSYHQQEQSMRLNLGTISAMIASKRPALSKFIGWMAEIVSAGPSQDIYSPGWREVQVYCDACELVAN